MLQRNKPRLCPRARARARARSLTMSLTPTGTLTISLTPTGTSSSRSATPRGDLLGRSPCPMVHACIRACMHMHAYPCMHIHACISMHACVHMHAHNAHMATCLDDPPCLRRRQQCSLDAHALGPQRRPSRPRCRRLDRCRRGAALWCVAVWVRARARVWVWVWVRVKSESEGAGEDAADWIDASRRAPCCD